METISLPPGVISDEQQAQSYAERHGKMAENFGRTYARKLARRGYSAGRILDAGCGFGGTSLYLAQQFSQSEVVGVDLSEPLLRTARELAGRAGLEKRARFEAADVRQIPYPDGYFDVILNLNLLHLVAGPVEMLDEMERLLAPLGALFAADVRRSWLGWLEGEIRHGLSLAEARELFNRSKLRPGKFSWGLVWWYFESGRR